MLLSRKIVFQFVPLLDILLILIFAQFLDVKVSSDQQRADMQREADNRVAQAERRLQAESLTLEQLRNELQAKSATDAERMRVLEDRAVELTESREDLWEQQQRAGDVVAELFHVPQALIDQTFSPPTANEVPRTPAETERLKSEFQKLAALRGPDVIKHFLTYAEVQKRTDIWEIYIDETGMVTLTAGGQEFRFRAESAEEFQTALFNRYKALPEPKSLVIMLLSWGDARFSARKPATDGLPIAADRMRSDAGGRTRFEYAVIGFRPATSPPSTESNP